MKRVVSSSTPALRVDRKLDNTAYDNVVIVKDNIEDINAIADNITSLTALHNQIIPLLPIIQQSGANATASADNATAAQLRAWEAQANKMTTDSYATEPVNTFVKVYTSNGNGTFASTNTTEYSSLHYASKADTTLSSAQSHITSNTNPHNVTKSQVGLGNVDNTSDLNKIISTATQTALNAKANISGQVFTGAVSAPNLSATNTGDETTSSIQTKRPLKTIEGQSLEGVGDINLNKLDKVTSDKIWIVPMSDYRAVTTQTGALQISMPVTTPGNTMINLEIVVEEYTGQKKTFNIAFLFANAATPVAQQRGTSSHANYPISITADGKIIIGTSITTWSHPRVKLTPTLRSTGSTNTAWLNPWVVSYITEIPAGTTVPTNIIATEAVVDAKIASSTKMYTTPLLTTTPTTGTIEITHGLASANVTVEAILVVQAGVAIGQEFNGDCLTTGAGWTGYKNIPPVLCIPNGLNAVTVKVNINPDLGYVVARNGTSLLLEHSNGPTNPCKIKLIIRG